MFNRVIIKLSGEAIGKNSDANYNDNIITGIGNDIKVALAKGLQISVVIGGGNLWRGRNATSSMNRSKADQIGMLATIMNGIYVCDLFNQLGIDTIVFTPFQVGNFTTDFTVEAALSHMNNGGVCIFSGGLGLPYFSTDTIAALRACELQCDAILYAKTIDGIYNKDPNKKGNEDAVKYDEISYMEFIKKDLKAIDISAMNLCKDNNITSVVFNLDQPESIKIAVENDDSIFEIGSRIVI